MSWRERALEIINKRIDQLAQEPGWSDLAAEERASRIKAVVDSHYPFAQRTGWAYQAWLNARADIFAEWGIPTKRTKPRPPTNRKGWRKPVEVAPGQLSLFDSEEVES